LVLWSMAVQPLLYYITDRKAFPGDETGRRRRLLEKIAEAARCGVDYIQLREKDLSARELELLACDAVRAVRQSRKLGIGNRKLRTALLVNSRTDVALATGADGVHLRSDDVSPSDVRGAWKCGAGAPSAGSGHTLGTEDAPRAPVISISCHSADEVTRAAAEGADLAAFAPVFEKKDSAASRAAGLAALQAACAARIPVLALGGVTIENAQSCLEAGAAGIAAIRLFQENDIASVVRAVRG
jgi:thiamine-phosphate pyrophosphorylase